MQRRAGCLARPLPSRRPNRRLTGHGHENPIAARAHDHRSCAHDHHRAPHLRSLVRHHGRRDHTRGPGAAARLLLRRGQPLLPPVPRPRGHPEELESGLADTPSDDLAEPDGLFLIGCYDGAAQSCAGLRRHDADTVELTRVFVRPGLRGTGGGSRLLAAVDEAARSLGAHRIVLDTRLDLVEARALYTRHGYREIPAYSSGPYAQIWYGKELGR